MFNQPFLYLFIASEIFIFAMQMTVKKIRPRSPLMPFLMSILGLLSQIANVVFIILYAINADHWWHALVAGVLGFFASVLIPPTKIEMVLGYLGIIGAPLCVTLAYLNLFNVI
jgi:hypothetical protein